MYAIRSYYVHSDAFAGFLQSDLKSILFVIFLLPLFLLFLIVLVYVSYEIDPVRTIFTFYIVTKIIERDADTPPGIVEATRQFKLRLLASPPF